MSKYKIVVSDFYYFPRKFVQTVCKFFKVYKLYTETFLLISRKLTKPHPLLPNYMSIIEQSFWKYPISILQVSLTKLDMFTVMIVIFVIYIFV